MTNQEKMDLLINIFNIIFQSKALNTEITQSFIQSPHIVNGRCNGRWYKNNTLRGFDIDINTGLRILPIRCLEQNPNKQDNRGNLTWPAALVQQGHQIMWAIDRSPAGEFLGRLQKDAGQEEIVWHPSFEPATRPADAAYNYNTPEHEARLDAAYAHIEKDINDPNFHGAPGTSGTSMENVPYQRAPDMAAITEPIDINELPELPPEVDIPDYILETVAAMDEPPDWEDDYE